MNVAEEKRRMALPNSTDAEIQTAVQRELQWETRVDETDIAIGVKHGVVTLRGTVPYWAQRYAAQEAAHRVAGVLDVANELEVHAWGTEPNDTEIAAAVRTALQWDVFVPDQKIHSTVSNGWVTLEGIVDSWNEHDDAERVLRNLRGIHGVSNKIQVKPQGIASERIKDAIEAALERQAQREARNISVVVDNGKVSVQGRVHSWKEKQAALGVVRGTRGVHAIEDHLRVDF